MSKEKKKHCCEQAPGKPCGCGDPNALRDWPPPAERNRYFTGKYLTARDLAAEQDYYVSRHRLHQRALHGAGIVVGLDVYPAAEPDCAERGWLRVTPGIAIDDYGREVFVRTEQPVEPPTESGTYLLVIEYEQTCIEKVPVFADLGGCQPREEFNRVREGCKFEWIPVPDPYAKKKEAKPKDHGDTKDEKPAEHAKDHQEANTKEKSAEHTREQKDAKPGEVSEVNQERKVYCWDEPLKNGCACPDPVNPQEVYPNLDTLIESVRKCQYPLALARVTFAAGANDGEVHVEPGDRSKLPEYIEIDRRRYLPGPLNPRQLTHICKTNWQHGNKTPDAVIWKAYHDVHKDTKDPECDKKNWGIRLTVTFDRELHADAEVAVKDWGDRLFSVRFLNHDGEEQTAALKSEKEKTEVTLSKCRRHLHCDIAAEHLREGMHEHRWVFVTVHCSELKDRWGRAVDGDFLLSRLPTGDGVEGGRFESWFRLVKGDGAK